MPNLTPNLGLKKPLDNETADIAVINENMDMLDIAVATHLADTMITQDKVINVPTDYPTIQSALNSFKKAWIPKDVTVTIQIAAGTYNHSSPIIVNHPCASRIQIVGATPVITVITGKGTITGSVGDWRVPIKVQSTNGIASNDYVIIKDTDGSDDHYVFRGIWQVISVDSSTQITVKNTHRGTFQPSATLNGGTLIALKTILKFTNCYGMIIASGSSLGFLDQIALVGDGSAAEGLAVGRAEQDTNIVLSASVFIGSKFGVNGFGYSGVDVRNGGSVSAYSGVASSGNGLYGFYAENASLHVNGSIATGNGNDGYLVLNGGSIVAEPSTASGNGGNGYSARDGGNIAAYQSTATSNSNNGFYSNNSSSIAAGSSFSSYNGNSGYFAEGGTIWANYSTANANLNSGFYALRNGSINIVAGHANTNHNHGYIAEQGGAINAWLAYATSSQEGFGFYALVGGKINAAESTTSGCTNGDYYAFLGGLLYVYGYKGTNPSFSPALNTVGNQNALISI